MSKRIFSDISESSALLTYNNASLPYWFSPVETLEEFSIPAIMSHPGHSDFLGCSMPISDPPTLAYQTTVNEISRYANQSEIDQRIDSLFDDYLVTDGNIIHGDDIEDCNFELYNEQEFNTYHEGQMAPSLASQTHVATEVSANPEPHKNGSRRPPVFTAQTYSLEVGTSGEDFGEPQSVVQKKKRKLLKRRGGNDHQGSEAGEKVQDVANNQSLFSGELPVVDIIFPPGTAEPGSINKLRESVGAELLPDSASGKNNFKRPAYSSGTKTPKRTSGANNPVNIQIVNLREQKDWSFRSIKEHLNAERVKNGLAPSYTDTSVANRYNRSAPRLFAASGQDFVPLRQRKKNWQDGPNHWTCRMKATLVSAEKLAESMKWAEVSRTFTSKHGIEIDPLALAKIHASFME